MTYLAKKCTEMKLYGNAPKHIQTQKLMAECMTPFSFTPKKKTMFGISNICHILKNTLVDSLSTLKKKQGGGTDQQIFQRQDYQVVDTLMSGTELRDHGVAQGGQWKAMREKIG